MELENGIRAWQKIPLFTKNNGGRVGDKGHLRYTEKILVMVYEKMQCKMGSQGITMEGLKGKVPYLI